MKKIEVLINGEAYPCRPSMGAMLRFKNETGKEVTEINPNAVSELLTYLWCCVVSGSKRAGKSFDDFCGYYFDEFDAIWRAWKDAEEARIRDAWERTRLLAAIITQPHVKRRLTPMQLIPLPWDKEKPKGQKQSAPQLSAEERRKRFETLATML